MSSILKALKKLELEKTGNIPVSLKIDSGILRTADSSRSSSPLVLTLLFLLVFGGGGGVVFVIMNKTGALQVKAQPQAVVKAENRQNIHPSAPALTVKPDTIPAIVPARKDQAGGTSQKQQQKPAAGKVVTTAVEKTAKTAVSGVPKQSKAAAETANAGLPAIAPPPALRVNGIAYQDQSADSVAMINGEPFSSGAVIDGAKIEEIHKSRVIFSYNGGKFEIPLGQSNR